MAKIAVRVASEYDDPDLDVPRWRLREAGHVVVIVGLQAGKRLKGKRGRSSICVQKTAREVSAAELDAELIPGGHSPDRLRLRVRVHKKDGGTPVEVLEIPYSVKS